MPGLATDGSSSKCLIRGGPSGARDFS